MKPQTHSVHEAIIKHMSLFAEIYGKKDNLFKHVKYECRQMSRNINSAYTYLCSRKTEFSYSAQTTLFPPVHAALCVLIRLQRHCRWRPFVSVYAKNLSLQKMTDNEWDINMTLVAIIMLPYRCPFVVLGVRWQDTVIDQVFISAYCRMTLDAFI